jgi:hypothetical protein
MDSPRAFISYSHVDRPMAESLATRLRGQGIDPWFAEWEIAPGDSLVQRIFEHGLKDANSFSSSCPLKA